MKSYSKYFNAFTLAEMMVVLLIMSIVLACLAPAMTTKMKADQNVQTSPWKWVQQGGGRNLDAYFGNGNLQMAHIGETERSEGDNAKLIINNSSLDDMILFKNGNNTLGSVRFQNDGLRIGSSNTVVGQGSVGIGTGITATSNSVVFGNSSSGGNNAAVIGNSSSSSVNGIIIGNSSNAFDNSVVIGNNINENSGHAVVIGNGAMVSDVGGTAVGDGAESSHLAVALGSQTSAHGTGSIAIGPQATALMESSIAIGTLANAETADYSIAIGDNASATASYGIAIGKDTKAVKSDTIAIGYNNLKANTSGYKNIAIGTNSMGKNTTGMANVGLGTDTMENNTTGGTNTAIGHHSMESNTTGDQNTALGYYSLQSNKTGDYNTAIGREACRYVTGSNKTCIGYGSGPASGSTFATNNDNIVFLGTANSTVYIPGRLVVGKHVFLNSSEGATVLRPANGRGGVVVLRQGDNKDGDDNMRGYPTDIWDNEQPWYNTYSDRRLKYVGKENSDGLAKLRQLKIFNYTFKKDEKKTPRVGVMAQDLQKIFPNAVKKGADGFLTIRMEDMFYAVINAIKELDARISALEKENKLLKEQNKALDARLKALEAKIK